MTRRIIFKLMMFIYCVTTFSLFLLTTILGEFHHPHQRYVRIFLGSAYTGGWIRGSGLFEDLQNLPLTEWALFLIDGNQLILYWCPQSPVKLEHVFYTCK